MGDDPWMRRALRRCGEKRRPAPIPWYRCRVTSSVRAAASSRLRETRTPSRSTGATAPLTCSEEKLRFRDEVAKLLRHAQVLLEGGKQLVDQVPQLGVAGSRASGREPVNCHLMILHHGARPAIELDLVLVLLGQPAVQGIEIDLVI